MELFPELFKALWVGGGTFKLGGGRGWRVDLLVVDVLVLICDKFQQSVVHVNVEVPQIQFIDRMVDFSSVLQ